MSTDDPSSHTRARLIDAACALVAERGWHAATSRAVAQRAGSNQALVNYHFGTKDALLRAALRRSVHELGELAAPAGARSLDELLDAALSGIDRAADAVPARVVFEATLEASRDRELAREVRASVDELRAMLSAAARRSGLPPKRALALATFLAAALDGLLLHRFVDPDTDVAGAGRALRRLLASGGAAR